VTRGWSRIVLGVALYVTCSSDHHTQFKYSEKHVRYDNNRLRHPDETPSVTTMANQESSSTHEEGQSPSETRSSSSFLALHMCSASVSHLYSATTITPRSLRLFRGA